jgi:hypothetical protein
LVAEGLIMRSRWIVAACAVVIGLLLSAETANAQPPIPGGYVRPSPFSPYLNLNRGGSAALNYYGLVRPEMQFRQSLLNLAGDVSSNQQAIGNLGAVSDQFSFTGHPTQFMNLGGYFMNNGSMNSSYGFGSQSAMANRRRFSASFAPGSMGGASGRLGLGVPPRR